MNDRYSGIGGSESASAGDERREGSLAGGAGSSGSGSWPPTREGVGSAGDADGGPDRAAPRYFCHQCQRLVSVKIDEGFGDVQCGECGNSFVEMVENVYGDEEIEHPALFPSARAIRRQEEEMNGADLGDGDQADQRPGNDAGNHAENDQANRPSNDPNNAAIVASDSNRMGESNRSEENGVNNETNENSSHSHDAGIDSGNDNANDRRSDGRENARVSAVTRAPRLLSALNGSMTRTPLRRTRNALYTQQVNSPSNATITAGLASGITQLVEGILTGLQVTPANRNLMGYGINRHSPVTVVVHSGRPSELSRLGGNFGDYHFGGIDQLLHQLMQANPGSRGNPPASKHILELLQNEKKKITEEDVKNEVECAVCKDTFQVDSECIELPCKHCFCIDCILPWLKEHNTCPVCRHELPTDDPEYEKLRERRQNESSNIPETGENNTELTEYSEAAEVNLDYGDADSVASIE